MDSKTIAAVISGGVVFLGLLLAGFFLAQTGISPESVFSLSLSTLANQILSASFLGVVVFLAFAISGVAMAALLLDKKTAWIVVVSPAVLALIVDAVLFKLGFLVLPGIFLVLGMGIGIETGAVAASEIKNWKTLRASARTAGRIGFWIGIGLFVWGVSTLQPAKAEFGQKFEEQILDQAFAGINADELKAQATNTVVTTYLSAQAQLLNQLTSSENYLKLKTKEDPDVAQFVNQVSLVQNEIGSPEYKKRIEEAASQTKLDIAQTRVTSQDLIAKTIPWYNDLKEWLWLIVSFGIATMFWMLSSLVIRPLAAVFGLALTAFVQGVVLKASAANPEIFKDQQ